MKIKANVYLVFAFLMLVSCKGKILDPQEADRSMKILNSNLMNLLSTGSEKPEYQALAFLFNLEDSPLPFHKKKNPVAPDTVIYNIEKNKGNYIWDADSNTFKKTENADHISLNFPLAISGVNTIRFDLIQYKSQAYSSRPDLPVLVDAIICDANRQIASIKHTANITNNLPENISTAIKGLDYEAGFELRRTQIKKDGKLKIDLFLKSKGFDVISGNVDAAIEYSRQGYFFKTINFYLKLHDHHVTGTINYGEINPTAADYIDSFNSHSSIILYEGKNEVGKIVLNKTDNKELLDYFIKFSNGSETLLSTYIPVLKKLLNLKY